MKADNFKPLYIILALLSVVVLVQSYFLYDLKTGLESKPTQKIEHVVAKIPQKDDFVKNFNATNSDPFEQMQRMQEQMQKSFGEFNSIFADDPFFQEALNNMSTSPLSDIKETDKSYIVKLNIPGANENEIKIIGEGEKLTVLATSEGEKENKEGSYVHKERFARHFERSFNLPANADLSAKSSSYKDGVLRITIPKKG